MRHHFRSTTARAASTIAVAAACAASLTAPSAQAATGGPRVTNPGIVALTDDAGNHLCTGVLVAERWVLTQDGSMPCHGSSKVTGDVAANAVTIDREAFPFPVDGWIGNDPSKSGAMLLHLDKPVKNVKPAKLSDAHPMKGEKLDVVAFNGPEGINHTLGVGRGSAVAKNHNAWLSYYGALQGMTLEGYVDNGAAVMRGDTVVALGMDATPRGLNAEDISNVHAWITEVTGAK